MTSPPWPEGPAHPPLPVTGVHVWMADFHRPAMTGAVSMATLSPEEIGRAQGARSAAYRVEFVQTRQTLRALLGRYLRVPPSEIMLQSGTHGKPSLAPQHGHALQFNLSHTGGMAMFAFACGREVGIDVDRLDRVADWQGVAKRSFSQPERQAMERLPEAERGAAFMRGWIRKEAYAKARGAGFRYGFSNFTVSLAEQGDASLLLHDTLDAEACRNWALLNIGMTPPLNAAVATQEHPAEITLWQFGPAT